MGYSVGSPGDVNVDGYDDVIVGALADGPSGEGVVYVIFGRSGVPAVTDVNLATMEFGTLGFRIYGAGAGAQLGYAVSGAGDVNGDGVQDMRVGARLSNIDGISLQQPGMAVVIFGHNAAIPFPDIDTGSSLGGLGFRMYGEESSDWIGSSVSRAGDVNDDGYDDFIVGARAARFNNGAAYVVFGFQSSCLPGTHYGSPTQTDVCIDCPVGRYANTFGGAAECNRCGLVSTQSFPNRQSVRAVQRARMLMLKGRLPVQAAPRARTTTAASQAAQPQATCALR